MSVARQVTRLATGLPPDEPDAWTTFEIPLHVVQDDRRSEDLPFGSRGGTAVRYNFPADGEYLIKVRLRTNWQDYIKGMGWPQQLDIRLDGERLQAASRSAGKPRAGRRHRVTPALASRVAGDPTGKSTCMVGGDRRLEIRCRSPRARTLSACRSSGSCGSRKGSLNRCSGAGVIANDERLHGLPGDARGADRGPIPDSQAWRGTRQPSGNFHLPARRQCRQSAVRHEEFFRGWRGSLIAGRSRNAIWRRCSAFSSAAARRAEASTPAFSSRSSFCSAIRSSCCASIAIPRPADRPAAPPSQRPRAGLAPVVLLVEQHPRRTAARPR